jgi:hypothetical protein
MEEEQQAMLKAGEASQQVMQRQTKLSDSQLALALVAELVVELGMSTVVA